VGVTATANSPSSGQGTIADSKPGAFLSVGTGASLTSFSWGSVTGNSNGTQTCTDSTIGTYVTSNATATLATNLRDAINACNTSFSAVGTTATASGSTVTVTNTTKGTTSVSAFSVGAANNSSIFSWGSVTAGTNGSNACGSSTAGTFATSASTTTLASNLAAAINLCPAGAGVSATSSVDTVTATDTTSGSFTTFSVAGSNLTGIYSWSGVTAGTNGTTNGC